ncbi:MAG: ABC transporter ATP-binding protein [Candidatus Woesearchaeota archaeon]
MADDIVSVQNVTKSFTSYKRKEGFLSAVTSLFKRDYVTKVAVDSISFSIQKGDIVGFLGPNGAGKSTTLKMLSGIMSPTSGTIRILDMIPHTQRLEYVKHIGAVFGQKTQLYWDLPPVDAFYLHKDIYKIQNFEQQLAYLSEMLAIKEYMYRPTRQLSLGERMRCEFACALLHRPRIVFLDEPTIGVDIIAKEIIRNFIVSSAQKFGTTYIITSHDLEDIEHVCNRVIVINHGTIIFDNPIQKLKLSTTKHVTITYKKPFTPKTLPKHVTIEKQLSAYSILYNVDVAKQPIDYYISKLKFNNAIDDIEVKNLPIGQSIKLLYEQKV